MLLDFLSQYLGNVGDTVREIEGAYVERYEEEIVASDRANLRIRIRFPSGHLLELNEAIVGEEGKIRHLGYRYHFQDGQHNLVFGHDNTPHFPEIATYPHHKHLPAETGPNDQPSIIEVIEEARSLAGKS